MLVKGFHFLIGFILKDRKFKHLIKDIVLFNLSVTSPTGFVLLPSSIEDQMEKIWKIWDWTDSIQTVEVDGSKNVFFQ